MPEGEPWKFGDRPETAAERALFEDWWPMPDKPAVPAEQIDRLRDGYDSCISYLDARIGRLLGALRRRGVLQDTIVIVTSDHGEAFGEHELFGHGGSLYEDRIRVPLTIVAPGQVPAGRVVERPVSLRDVPATILGLLGIESMPMPGASLLDGSSALAARLGGRRDRALPA